ncbi:MAG: glycosyltransferase [Cyclobacteriaceae bacterium]
MPKYSIIVPVYNRPNETEELLESLAVQQFIDFELILVEDGSSETSKHLAEKYSQKIDLKYFFKENTGPGDSRNFGMEKASGNYFLFFDSDCVIPADYMSKADELLSITKLDAFGGPDNAHESFSNTQKAINYAMTSFFTTGGIRGGRKQLDKFQPRSFNMGFSREVYENTGGFSDIHPGEDPDLSYRIMKGGYKVGLIRECFVYHKRRIDFGKYLKQVYKFGVVRVVLNKWHPDKTSPVFMLPTLFLLGSLFCLASATISLWALGPLAVFSVLILLDSLLRSKSVVISFKALVASFIQLYGYGYGYLKSYYLLNLLGKKERVALRSFFAEGRK